jgi:DHA1 family multidrug resistance protein-like MFS transporter
MSDLLRDAPVGQVIRWVTRNKYLQYPEEKADFQCPSSYQDTKSVGSGASSVASPDALEKRLEELPTDPNALTTAQTAADRESVALSDRTLSKIMTRPEMSLVNTRADLEQAYTNATRQETLKNQASRPIAPAVTSDGTILVDWYTTDDPENPQNWTPRK